MKILEKISNLLMFQEGSIDDSYSSEPVVTTGSIIWGVLLRSLIIMLLSFFVVEQLSDRSAWWIAFFGFWLFAAYPAYKQFMQFNKRMADFQESTLCGSCKHFNSGGQLCTLYDEHVSKEHIPCGGEDWEPKESLL